MNHERDRAYRRWKLDQAKERARTFAIEVWEIPEYAVDPRWVGIAASVHMRWCSKPWCCGNARKFNGERTVQERRAGWK
jgi:hypothetical protein